VYKRTEKGFTLIELLIVIVIIGILAGVLVSVINPERQQNRARDANVTATMNKVALATEGFIAAYGRAPDGAELLDSIQNSSAATGVASATHDCTRDDNFCMFTVTGNNLPPGICDAADNAWTNATGAGTEQCYYLYVRETPGVGADATHFRLFAKSFGLSDDIFLYDNKVAEINQCDADATTAQIDTATATDGTPCQ
jgi:prepilin-type N-terminal cleavage/methylation domain-containing protein